MTSSELFCREISARTQLNFNMIVEAVVVR